MRKFIAGLVLGLLLATAGAALASPNVIRIFVNGQEVVPDVPPQVIDSRVMVPARFIAEPLGASVEWDAVNRAVLINSLTTGADPIALPVQPTDPKDDEWLTTREIVEMIGWEYSPDGYFFRDSTALFHYTEVKHKIENNRIYIHRSVLEVSIPHR